MRTTAFNESKRIRWSAYRNYSVQSFNFLSLPKSNFAKTFALVLFALVISNQVLAQEIQDDFLAMNSNNSTPKEVLKLAESASQWDVTKSEDFDGRNKLYTVVFKSNKGFISRTYDKKGNIVQSREVFKRVHLPEQLTKYVLQQYPDYKIVDNKYKSTSEIGKGVKSSYAIVLQSGDQKKHLKFKNHIE